MDISLSLDTREFVDLMNPPRLLATKDIILSQERERDEFKRTVEDVPLHVSDQDNYITQKLRSYPVSSGFEIKISDEGRQLFRGKVNRPIRTNAINDSITIQAFSTNKEFWEKTKNTVLATIYPNEATIVDEGGRWATLEYVIRKNCDQFAGEGIFTEYSISPAYANRKIRIAKNPNATILTNEKGLYNALGGTVFELLTAFGLYYNAEFFVDVETNRLTMLRRNEIQNDTEHKLDELLLSDDEIQFDDTDGAKYDYLHSFLSIDSPAPLVEYPYRDSPISSSDPPLKLSLYAYTNVYTGGIESSISEASGYRYEIYVSPGVRRFKYAFVLPKPGLDVVSQRIYVKVSNQSTRDANGWYLVRELQVGQSYNDSSAITQSNGVLFIDSISVTSDYVPGKNATWWNAGPEQYISKGAPTGHIWWRYNDATGKWETIIGYSNTVQPVGRIMEVMPKLNFYNPDGTTSSTMSETYAFFGNENDLSTFITQWHDFFVFKGRVFCSVKGLAYRLGDTFISSVHPKIPAGKYVVKKVYGNLIRKRSKLELIKV